MNQFTMNQFTNNKDAKLNVVVRSRVWKPKYLGCANVTFSNMYAAFCKMSHDERDTYIMASDIKSAEFLAPFYCKDCRPSSSNKGKPNKNCRHIRRSFKTPKFVHEILNRLARDARTRDNNRYFKTKLAHEEAPVRKLDKIYARELAKKEPLSITFGSFWTDATIDADGLECIAYATKLKAKMKKKKYLQRRAKRREEEQWLNSPIVGSKQFYEEPQFEKPLSARMRLMVEALRSKRTGDDLSSLRIVNLLMRSRFGLNHATYQMDTTKGETLADDQVPVTKQAGNVNIQLAEEVTAPISQPDENMTCFTHVESNNEFESFTSRYSHLGDFEWTTNGINTNFGSQGNKTVNSTISLDVFGDLYTRLNELNSPLVRPFKHFRFGSFDIEIMFKISSTIMQAGTLMGAVTYFQDSLQSTTLLNLEESKTYPKVNPALLSQRPHELLRAHDNTEITLKVPFRHWRTMVALNSAESSFGNWNYARVHLIVLNSLMIAGSTCATGALSGQIYVRLTNVQFTGMIPRAQVQMMSTAAFLLASKFLADPNNDLPGSYENSIRIQPTLAQSFAHGSNNLEHREILRLEPNVHTPHPETPDDFDERVIINRKGLLNIIDWKNSHKNGTILYSVECTPLLQKEKYISFKTDGTEAYVMPPVAVWASDKMTFSGGLVFTLDICTTKFSAGMLEVIYVPGELPDNFEAVDVGAYMHTILDIKEQKNFSVASPSIINTPVWYRRYVNLEYSSDYVSPGYIVIRVRQKLAVTCEIVPPDAKINVFVSGDTNLECHVLTAPLVQPLYYRESIAKVVFKTYYADGGIGTDHRFSFNVDYTEDPKLKQLVYVPLVRYGNQSEQVNYIDKDIPSGLYLSNLPMKYPGKTKSIETQIFLVTPIATYSGNYLFPLGLEKIEKADQLKLKKAFEDNPVPTMETLIQVLTRLSYRKYGEEYIHHANDITISDWTQNNEYSPIIVWEYKSIAETTRTRLGRKMGQFVAASSLNQNDNLVRMIPPVKGNSKLVFGERAVRIKDACRRKQFLRFVDLLGTNQHFIADQVIPVCTNYLNSRPIIEDRVLCNNFNLYGSGFLGFRGSLVYTILPLRRENGLLGVQHIPDLRKVVTDHLNSVTTGVVSPDVLLQPGYAQNWVDMNINGNLTVEVPFYRNARWIFAPKVNDDAIDDSEQISQCNGALKLFSTAEKPVRCGIWYSFGDDASFTYFQGFPAMRFIKDSMVDVTPATPPSARYQMFDKLQFEVKSRIDDMTAQVAPAVATVNMAAANFNDVVEPMRESLPTLIESGKATMNMMKDTTEKFAEMAVKGNKLIDSIPDGITTALMHVRNKATEIFDILSNFAHVLVDIKNWKHWAIFVVSILVRWGVTSRDCVTALTESFIGILKSKFDGVFNLNKLNFEGEAQDFISESLSSNPFCDSYVPNIPKAQNQGPVDWLAMGALIVSGISARCEVKNKYWYAGNISKLMLMTKSTATGFKWLREMFDCIFNFVSSSVNSLIVYFNPDVSLLNVAELEKFKIYDWYENVLVYTNPFNYDKVKNDPKYVTEVNKLLVYGQNVLSSIGPLKLDMKVVNVIIQANISLGKVRDKLRAEYIYGPPVEPFCVWVGGSAGIGKTYVQEHFIVNLLTSQNIDLNGREMIFTVPALSDYWERVDNQPVCVYDDILVYKDDQTSRETFGTFLSLVNKAPFTPPIAACEDKKKLYNPDIVWVNANWVVSDCKAIQDPVAFHRRRHYVLNAYMHPKFKCISHLKERDPSYESFYTGKDQYIKYTDIPERVYEAMVNLVYGELAPSPDGKIYVPPSPHLLFDVMTCHGESELRPVEKGVNSLRVAELLNQEFGKHRQKMYSLLQRSKNIEDSFKNDQKIISKKIFAEDGTEKECIFETNDKKFVLTETQLVSGRQVDLQEKIVQMNPPVERGALPIFNPDEINVQSYKKRESVYEKIKNDATILVDNVTKEIKEIGSLKGKLSLAKQVAKKALFQAPNESGSGAGTSASLSECEEREFKRIHQLLEDGEMISDDETMFFAKHCDEYLNKPSMEESLTMKAKKEISDDDALGMCLATAGLLALYDGGVAEMNEIIEALQSKTYSAEMREQLETKCMHHHFQSLYGYTTGVFFGKRKDGENMENVFMTDRPCPRSRTCPWHIMRTYQRDMSDWGYLHPHIVSNVFKMSTDDHELDQMPFHFKNMYHAGVRSANIVKEAQSNWGAYIKRVLLRKVPEFLWSIWTWIKKHMPTILAIVGLICSVVSTVVGIKQITKSQTNLGIAHHVGRYKEQMTPEQLVRYAVNSDEIIQAQMSSDLIRQRQATRNLADLLLELNGTVPTVMNEIINSGAQQSTRTKLSHRTSAAMKSGRVQSLNIPAIEGIKKKIMRNTFWLLCIDKVKPLDDVAGVEMRCLGLCNRWGLMPLHYVQYWKDQDKTVKELRIMHNGITLELPEDWFSPREIPESGLCLFELPKSIPCFQNLIKYVPYSYDDFDKLDLTSVTLIETVEQDVCYEKSGACQYTLVSAGGETPSQKEMIVHGAFEYNMITKAGMCGSVLMCGEKIIGMHIAGTLIPRPAGYSSAIIGEEFYPLVGLSPKRRVFEYSTTFEEEGMGHWSEGKMLPAKGVCPIGHIKDKAFHIYVPNESNWHKSVVHGVFESRKSPAVLSMRDERIKGAFSPLQEAINKHGLIPRMLPKVSFEIAKAYWINKHLSLMKPIKRQPAVLSLEQAICGIEGLNYYDKIEFNSSEGWPFCKQRPPGCSGKKWLFHTEVVKGRLVLKSINPQLKQVIESRIAETRDNYLGFNVVCDLLKDELKTNEKVLLPGKTRCFSGAAVDEVIRFKMYFQDYVANYMHYRFKNSSAIGMSCVGHEPTMLVNHMCHKGFTKHCCGDYTDFGPAFEANCGSVFYESATRWYEFYTSRALQDEDFERDQIARRCMSEGFVNPKHLVVDSVYQTVCGMSSGCPATAPCNTDVNKMYIAIAWLEITKTDLQTFEDNVILMAYGDDIWFSISDDFCEIFNNETLHHFFKQFRIKYTDNTKSTTEIRKYCSLDEVEFLKRKFIPHPTRAGEWLAALDKVSIEECANWIQKDPMDLEKTKQIVESAIELAYSHGKEYYMYVLGKLQQAWSTVLNAPSLRIRAWEELDRIFYGEIKGETQSYDSDWSPPEGAPESNF